MDKPNLARFNTSLLYFFSIFSTTSTWYLCQLQIGTCDKHWPETDLQQGICQLPQRRLTLCCWSCRPSTSAEGNSEWRTRHAPGKLVERVFYIVRYFQELISWSQLLHFFISRKSLNPFMVTSAPCDQQKTFCKITAWLHWTPHSPKSYILTSPHCLFGAVSESYLRCCLLCSVLILPQIKCSLATITSCVSPAFSMTSLVFPILLLSPFSLHCSVKKIFSSLLSILWSSAFRWVYLSFSLLLSLLFFSQLFVRPPLTTISFFWGWFLSLLL